MVHGQVAFDQELLVIRIEDCLLDVLAGNRAIIPRYSHTCRQC